MQVVVPIPFVYIQLFCQLLDLVDLIPEVCINLQNLQIVVAPWIHEGWVIYDHRIHHGPSKDPSIEKRLRDSNNASLRLLCVLHRVYFFAYVFRFWIYVELTFWVSHPLISFCDLRKIFVKLTALKCPFCVAVVVDVVDCSLNKKNR